MKHLIPLLALLGASTAWAGPIRIEAAYSHPTPAPGVPGVGFLTVVNTGPADRLLKAESPAAGHVEIHETRMADGVMRMRAVSDGVALPAGGTQVFQPGGLHLMLMALKAPLREGDSLPVTLRFEHAAPVTVQLEVKPRSVKPEASAAHKHH